MTVLLAALLVAVAQPSANGQTTPPAPDAAANAPVDPAKLLIARDIVAAVLPPDQRDKIMAAMLDAMMNNVVSGSMRGLGIDTKIASDPAVSSIFQAFVERQKQLALEDIHAALPGLVEAYAHAYARMFSAEDLREIKTFVQTPAGTRFMRRSSSLLSDPDVAEWQRTLAAQGAARQKGELQRLKNQLEAAGLKIPSRT